MKNEFQEILIELLDAGMRVEEIAFKVGCSYDTIHRWRRGPAMPMGIYGSRLKRLYNRFRARQAKKDEVVGP